MAGRDNGAGRGQGTVRAGLSLGTICIVGGLYVFFLTRDVSWLRISLIGWFLAGAATTEAQQAVLAGCNLTI